MTAWLSKRTNRACSTCGCTDHNYGGDGGMALRDEEQRQLAEIERRLAEDDPGLAHRLERLRSSVLPGPVRALAGVVLSVVVGLVLAVLGTETGTTAVRLAGLVLATGVPTLIAWRLWLRRVK